MKFSLQCLAIIFIPFYCLGQQMPMTSDPSYNSTVPRLIMLKHNESSNPQASKKVSAADFEGKNSSKETDIFVTYKRNDKTGKGIGYDNELKSPPKRLMDFHLIYGYSYNIFVDEAAVSKGLRFNMGLSPNDKVESISLESHVLQNGKISSRKISPKAFETSPNDSSITISVDASKLTTGSFLTLQVKVSSLNFGEIGPFGIENPAYTEFVSFNMPEIFMYNLVAQDVSMELVSNEKRAFELLHFLRDREGTINKFKIDNYCYKWKVSPKVDGGGYKFDLAEILFPERKDIGIRPIDLHVL